MRYIKEKRKISFYRHIWPFLTKHSVITEKATIYSLAYNVAPVWPVEADWYIFKVADLKNMFP